MLLLPFDTWVDVIDQVDRTMQAPKVRVMELQEQGRVYIKP